MFSGSDGDILTTRGASGSTTCPRRPIGRVAQFVRWRCDERVPSMEACRVPQSLIFLSLSTQASAPSFRDFVSWKGRGFRENIPPLFLMVFVAGSPTDPGG